MSKKVIAVLSVLVLLFAGAVMASEGNPPFTPGEGLFTAGQALEAAQLEMAEGVPEEVVELLDEFAGRGLAVIELLIVGDKPGIPEFAAALAQREQLLGEVLAEVGGFDGDTFDRVFAASEKRGARLQELLDDEDLDLPQGALDGIARALANQEAALDKAQTAYAEAMAKRDTAQQGGMSGQVDGLDTDDTNDDESGPPDNLPQPGRPDETPVGRP